MSGEATVGAATSAPAVRSRRRRVAWTDVLVRLVATIAVLFLVLPTVFALVSAFGVDRFPTFPPKGLTVAWFGEIDNSFLRAARTSLVLAAATTVLSTVLGVPAGIALARWQGRGASLVSAIARSPMQIPYVVIGVASLQFYVLIAKHLDVALIGTIVGLALVHAVIATPYMIGAVSAAAVGLSRDLELAAHGLGASRVRTFFSVTLPALRNAIVAGGVFSFLISFDDVPVTLFLVGSGQQTLPVKLFFGAEFSLTPQLFAVAAVLTAVTTIVVVTLSRALGLKRIAGV